MAARIGAETVKASHRLQSSSSSAAAWLGGLDATDQLPRHLEDSTNCNFALQSAGAWSELRGQFTSIVDGKAETIPKGDVIVADEHWEQASWAFAASLPSAPIPRSGRAESEEVNEEAVKQSATEPWLDPPLVHGSSDWDDGWAVAATLPPASQWHRDYSEADNSDDRSLRDVQRCPRAWMAGPRYCGLNLEPHVDLIEQEVRRFAEGLAKDFMLTLPVPPRRSVVQGPGFAWPATLHVTVLYPENAGLESEVLQMEALEGSEWDVHLESLVYAPDACLTATVHVRAADGGQTPLPFRANAIPHMTLLTRPPCRPRHAHDLLAVARTAGVLRRAKAPAAAGKIILCSSVVAGSRSMELYATHIARHSPLLRCSLQHFYGVPSDQLSSTSVPLPTFTSGDRCAEK